MTGFEEYIISKGWVTKDKGDYSSLGTIYKKYTKYGDIDIYFGLSEKGLPPTILSPRPLVLEPNCFYAMRDHDINRILNKNAPSEVLDIIRKKEYEKINNN
tara:strand:+ start:40 stop:342 length:303 start_codon:yes stop_codon:yes gene_type:complete